MRVGGHGSRTSGAVRESTTTRLRCGSHYPQRPTMAATGPNPSRSVGARRGCGRRGPSREPRWTAWWWHRTPRVAADGATVDAAGGPGRDQAAGGPRCGGRSTSSPKARRRFSPRPRRGSSSTASTWALWPGLRDRALLSVMLYSFARVSAVLGMRTAGLLRAGEQGVAAALREGREAARRADSPPGRRGP